jgi:hypothetical protein
MSKFEIPRRPHKLVILLVFGLLTTSSGCQVLGIPSYRADQADARWSPPVEPGGCLDTSWYPLEDHLGECPTGCSAGILPPLPHWLAERRAKSQLPEPPAFPRFHPLPTRPMFSPVPLAASANWAEALQAPAYGSFEAEMPRPPNSLTAKAPYQQVLAPTPVQSSSSPGSYSNW